MTTEQTQAIDAQETAKPRALVVGLGIAGLTTANRLSRIGWDATVVERSRGRRRGGYFIALFKSGQKPADRMGLSSYMHDRASKSPNAWDIDRAGNRKPGLGYSTLTGGDTNKIGQLLLRGDVENAGFDALPKDVEVRYATMPVAIEQDPDGVNVTLKTRDSEETTVERFELVVGADGIHSTTRKLAFGVEESEVLVPTGNMIVAFTLDEPVPGFPMNESLILSEVGRAAWVFSFEDHNPTVLFSYNADDVVAEKKRNPYESVREAFASSEGYGETLEWLIEKFEESDEFLYDSADQVHMDTWHKGRVVLVGDSAWCLTLYSGMGASAGIAGADALGTILERNGSDVVRALSQWEDHMRPFINKNMDAGMNMRTFFTANSKQDLLRRKMITSLNKTELSKKLVPVIQKRLMQFKIQDIAAAA